MAKKFKFKLESVLKYAKNMENVKKIEFVMAQKEYYLAIQKKEELERSKLILEEEKREIMLSGFDFTLISMYENYIEKIKNDILKAEEVIADKKREMEEKRAVYIEMRKKRKGYELLKEKALKKYNEKLMQEEMKFNDELGVLKYNERNRK